MTFKAVLFKNRLDISLEIHKFILRRQTPFGHTKCRRQGQADEKTT